MEEVIQPFTDLPEALVEEMLAKSEEIGISLCNLFENLQKERKGLRKALSDKKILKRDTDIVYPDIPTTCGIDGSYAVEKLLAIDFVACAAVAVEGLIPPVEKRHWERPHHRVFISPEKHNPDSGSIIRGLMMEMEIELAVKAPHDVVFLDGSLSTPLIFLNQAINKIIEIGDTNLSRNIIERFDAFIENYRTILESKRSDKLWVGIPKYTTKRELGEFFNWPKYYDDRAILTSILKPGEFTTPIPVGLPSQPWHLKTPSGEINKEFDKILKSIHVIYYKPHKWTPALRIEVGSSIAKNNARLAILLHGIKYQCGTPGIFEPYPLYMADKMVKHLGKALPAFRQNATKNMAERYKGDIGEVFFNMHGYRTETGR